MKRPLFALLVLVSAAANQGCQSCCAPDDYASPVANCGDCRHGRAGSAITGGHAVVVSQPEYIDEEEASQIAPPPPERPGSSNPR